MKSIEEQVEELKRRGLDSYLDKDLAEFEIKFTRLKKLLNEPANNENFEEAYNMFYYIFSVIPLLANEISVPYLTPLVKFLKIKAGYLTIKTWNKFLLANLTLGIIQCFMGVCHTKREIERTFAL